MYIQLRDMLCTGVGRNERTEQAQLNAGVESFNSRRQCVDSLNIRYEVFNNYRYEVFNKSLYKVLNNYYIRRHMKILMKYEVFTKY